VTGGAAFGRRSARGTTLLAFAGIALLVGVAHFLHASRFGLYEDDYHWVSPALEQTGNDLFDHLSSALHASHGRPLAAVLFAVLPFLGERLGELPGMYWVAFLIVALNACLFFLLLRRLSDEALLVAAGTLAFCLFPADTTQAFLTHAFSLQLSLTLLLTAFHLYLSRRRVVSYLAAGLTLLCYETFFPVFLAAPLLGRRDDSRRRDLGRHVAILVSMLVVVFLVRRVAGEGRVAGIGVKEIVLAAFNLVLGPGLVIGSFAYRPIEALHAALVPDWELVGIWILGLAAFGILLTRLGAPSDSGGFPSCTLVDGPALRIAVSEPLHRLGRLAGAAVVMFFLAYLLTLSEPAYALIGRATRVHAAAILGCSLLIGCCAAAVGRLAPRVWPRRFAGAALALLFASLLAACLKVQHDYREAWRDQRTFWSDVVRLVPDLEDGTVVLADCSSLPGRRPLSAYSITGVLSLPQIHALSWSVPIVLRQLYRFPPAWRHPPTVFQLYPDWRVTGGLESGTLRLTSRLVGSLPAGDNQRSVPARDVVILEAEGGRLARRLTSIAIGESVIALKPRGRPPTPPLPRGALYSLLLGAQNELQ
jgi:hypothetical protein